MLCFTKNLGFLGVSENQVNFFLFLSKNLPHLVGKLLVSYNDLWFNRIIGSASCFPLKSGRFLNQPHSPVRLEMITLNISEEHHG